MLPLFSASIVPNNYAYTITTSIGESVTLEVDTDFTDLRWSHNGGPNITNWEGRNKITIDNVRKGDEGIYECYNDGEREEAKHAIMRLIVRGTKRINTMDTLNGKKMLKEAWSSNFLHFVHNIVIPIISIKQFSNNGMKQISFEESKLTL